MSNLTKNGAVPASQAPLIHNAGMLDANRLNELGEKIFLDRYAVKDMTRSTLAVGDTVVVMVNANTNQREIGKVSQLNANQAVVELRDGTVMTVAIEHVDKPLETHPAQMMDRVARGVASIEKTAELRQTWEQKFRSALDGFKFVPAGRILTAAGSDQNLTYYNCMPPDQEILTASGYKAIGEVKVGERVVTHRNRLRHVTAKFERETEESLYVISPKKLGYDQLRVTGEHKIYSIRSEWVNKHRSRDGLRLEQEPTWTPAKALKPGDYLAVAYNDEECPPQPIRLRDYVSGYTTENGKLFKPTIRGEHGYVKDWGTHFSLNETLTIDGDLCFLFGRWLGDGCITHRTKTDIPSGIKIVFALDEREVADKIAQIIESKFGVSAEIKLSSTDRWYDLWVNSMPLGQFFKNFLGCYSYGKQIPDELMHLPKDLTLHLLHGLFSADGYTSDNKLGIVLSNRELTVQIHQLLLRLGYLFSIKENTHRLGRTPAYRLQATANECGPLFETFFGLNAPTFETDLKYYFEYDGLRWVRIDQISIENYSGTVMDIEVEEDHSFVSAGVVVSNCYVVPSPQDSRQGIMSTLTQMTEIMSRGGGVGINLSSLRPAHSYVKGVNGRSSGSVSWGALYSFVTGLIEQGGSRRGALMLILDDWHPDIFNFINSKRTAGKITNANISVGVSDALMAAVKADADWDLVFPDTTSPDYNETWDGNLEVWRAAGKPIIKHKTVKAREVWNTIIESAWDSAEPGVFFNDRYNKMSNSWYFAPIICTNPCGEQGLPGWGVCNLGAVNLAKFYDASKRDVAWRDLGETVRTAVRFLDNVIDVTPYFFDENYAQQQKERRVGLNTMGLAELMLRLGIRYGSAESVRWLDRLYEFIATESYEASIELAKERGAFPAFDADKHLQSGFMKSLPQRICEKVAKHGIRNVTLLTQAPNGTIGTMVDTSTGIEPFFSWTFYRKSRLGLHEQNVAVVEEWKQANPGHDLPDYFVTAMELSPEEHVRVQAAIQRWVDSSISKTCNVPNEYTVEQVRKLYEQMYDLGCKGGTIYRDGSRDEQVLMLKEAEKKAEPEPVVAEEPQPAIAPLPMLRQGITVSKHTAMGTLHLTSTHDENGEPFEVFMTVGKAGSDLQADGEALGRLISLLLRVASPLSRRERLEMVISQLEGIGGARTVGFGANRVSSMPDALASALRQIYFGDNGVQQLALPSMGFPAPPINGSKTNGHAKNGQNGHAKHSAYSTTEINGEVVVKISGADMCPSCGMVTLVRSEGCKKCQSCGYSEC